MSFSCNRVPEQESDGSDKDTITMEELNISEGPMTTSKTFIITSRSNYPLKFDVNASEENAKDILSFSPSISLISLFNFAGS